MADRRLVLVTGGSGYIAGYCIAQLLKDGWSVRTTVRSLTREAEMRGTIAKLVAPENSLEVLAADLTADAGWREAATGCSHILHVASPLPSQ